MHLLVLNTPMYYFFSLISNYKVNYLFFFLDLNTIKLTFIYMVRLCLYIEHIMVVRMWILTFVVQHQM